MAQPATGQARGTRAPGAGARPLPAAHRHLSSTRRTPVRGSRHRPRTHAAVAAPARRTARSPEGGVPPVRRCPGGPGAVLAATPPDLFLHHLGTRSRTAAALKSS
ncbi:hypothetical protein [Streptomyces sp. NPDC003023]|uniref:hypothetical protein n=1 Tax=Streptomyces sp. NPDC003023 TaxID=3364675 RepID=UPI0036821365